MHVLKVSDAMTTNLLVVPLDKYIIASFYQKEYDGLGPLIFWASLSRKINPSFYQLGNYFMS